MKKCRFRDRCDEYGDGCYEEIYCGLKQRFMKVEEFKKLEKEHIGELSGSYPNKRRGMF